MTDKEKLLEYLEERIEFLDNEIIQYTQAKVELKIIRENLKDKELNL